MRRSVCQLDSALKQCQKLFNFVKVLGPTFIDVILFFIESLLVNELLFYCVTDFVFVFVIKVT